MHTANLHMGSTDYYDSILRHGLPLSTDLGLSQRAFHTDAAASAERLYLF